jgi:hypothetical protein
MNRLEKIKMAIEKGITCNPETGEVFGIRGKVMTSKHNGYIDICFVDNEKNSYLKAHQFIWYWANKEIVDCIDHVNGVRDDNRICNLRSITHQQNCFNRKTKGYYWNKVAKKWHSRIVVNYEDIYLGLFDTEKQAHEAYLDAKKIYHKL